MTTLSEHMQQQPQQSEEPQEQSVQHAHNVGSQERLYSGAAGGLLAMVGLKRGGLSGLLMLGAGAALIHRAATGYCALYDRLGIDTSDGAAAPEEYFNRSIHVEESFLVNKPAAELFAFWRNFENLPRIMSHLESVTVRDENRSHWVAKAPLGQTVQWDAEIINEEPDRLIAWRSLGGADVDNAGSVRFLDAGDRGTEVKVTLDYIPPAGRLGALAAKLFREDPEHQVREDLRTFKRLMETGEVPTTEGQPAGA